MDKISVLIPDGDDDRALIVVRAFSYSKNIKVHILASTNRGVFLSRHCNSHRLELNEGLSESRLDKVIQISKNYKIDILFPIGELGTEFVLDNIGVLQKLFSIPPIPDLNSLKVVGDKWLLNEFCSQSKILYPKSFLLESQTNIKELDLNYPVLLKPRVGAGGIGIDFFESEDQLTLILESLGGSKCQRGYIIQEYTKGSDIDLSALCLKGEVLAYTIQQPINKERNSFSFGKMIELIDNNTILRIAEKCFSSLNWSGVAHIDFIHNGENDHYSMIDFNPRYWGTLIGSIVGGVNFPYLACLAAQGKSFPRPVYENSKFAILEASHLLLWLFQANHFNGIPFSHTNIKYVISDPLPALLH